MMAKGIPEWQSAGLWRAQVMVGALIWEDWHHHALGRCTVSLTDLATKDVLLHSKTSAKENLRCKARNPKDWGGKWDPVVTVAWRGSSGSSGRDVA